MDNTTKDDQNSKSIWKDIVRFYEFIEGGQISNSFIILKVLNETEKPQVLPKYLKKYLQNLTEKYSKFLEFSKIHLRTDYES